MILSLLLNGCIFDSPKSAMKDFMKAIHNEDISSIRKLVSSDFVESVNELIKDTDYSEEEAYSLIVSEYVDTLEYEAGLDWYKNEI